MRVIGTAGHVDHGKSTLIQALTGTHPDRLKEEQEREMTIELGFAWWNLPNGEEVGVVDVPGHRDFIENMLAGVGGIDAVVFVVAADEGVMPQTREHLSILDILQTQAGVVALTKIDMIDDPDWIDLIESDVRDVLKGTVLENAEIMRVSAKTGEGLEQLQDAISNMLDERPRRPNLGRPRLPIDRVFTMSGFGTVVTGTLIDGEFQVGDEVEVLPSGLKGRVRGLQNHKRKEEISQPGSRSAVNVSGIDVNQIKRGEVLAHPNDFIPTRRLDVQFRLLPDASHPLKHNQVVKFFIGATEMQARVRLLGLQDLKPGEEAWLQLEPKEPVVAVRGDRYILRRPSPGETLGGGIVLDPHPGKRYKRFSNKVLEKLKALTAGTPDEILLQALLTIGVGKYQELMGKSNLEESEAVDAFIILQEKKQVLILGDVENIKAKTLLTSLDFWNRFKENSLKEVNVFHQAQPLRLGMPREELKSRLKLDTSVFNPMISKLVDEDILSEKGPLVFLPDHRVEFSDSQESAANALITKFEKTPFAPPTIKECISEASEELYQAMVDLEMLLPLSREIAIRPQDFEKAVVDVNKIIEEFGSISLGQARDYWGTTRRYVQAILEYMDQNNITRRDGDVRVLRGK